jgi:hypothetical protein
MHCVIMGTSNTPIITWSKIIQSTVFTNYPHEGIAFFLDFVWAMQYPSRSPCCLQKTPNKVLRCKWDNTNLIRLLFYCFVGIIPIHFGKICQLKKKSNPFTSPFTT